MTLSKATLRKIEEINSMIETVNNASDFAYTYDGGTYPSIVSIKPIEIKNQFVTISDDKNGNYIGGKMRFNTNKKSMFNDANCSGHLNHFLNTILKAFKKVNL